MTSIRSFVVQSSPSLQDSSASDDSSSPSSFSHKYTGPNPSLSKPYAGRSPSSAQGDFSCIKPYSLLYRSHTQMSGVDVPWRGCEGKDWLPSIGGLGLGRCCALDMYKPVIRSYPSPYGREMKGVGVLDYLRLAPFLENIEVATTWKGLSIKGAEGLFTIHQIFKASLENLLADRLHELHLQFQHKYTGPHMRGITRPDHIRQIPFSQSDLIQTMAWMLSPQRKLQGSMMLLRLYLSTCDCLMQTDNGEVQDVAIEVCICEDEASFYFDPPRPVFEAAWIPDLLYFEPVAEVQREGQELIIIPCYRSNTLWGKDLCHNDIGYALCSSQPWLSWDESIHGFRGVVPMSTELRTGTDRLGEVYRDGFLGPRGPPNRLRIEIKALVTHGRRPFIRIERVVRARLTFKIIPWYAQKSFSRPSDKVVSPLENRVFECTSPTISLDGSISLLNARTRKHLSDTNEYSMDTCCTSTLHKEFMELNTKESLSPANTTPNLESRKRRASSSLVVASPSKRHREIQAHCACGESSTTAGNDECIHVSASSASSSRLENELNAENSSSPYLDHFSPLCDLQPGSSVTKETSRSRSSSYGDSDGAKPGVEAATEFGVCVSSEGLQAKQTRRRNLDSAYYSNETAIESEVLAQATQSNGQLAMQRLMLPPLLDEATDCSTTVLHEKLRANGSGGSQSHCSQGFDRAEEMSPPETTQDRSDSESGASRLDSVSLEIIVGNDNIDPRIRREQAMLWKMLYTKSPDSVATDPTLNFEERKDMYDAMKRSAEEEQDRRNKKLGLSEILDDLFLDDNDASSGSQNEASSEAPERLSDTHSELASGDQELANSFNYGF